MDRLGSTLAREVDARLREHTDPKRREFTRGYFPSALENLGVAVPHVRKLGRDLVRRLRGEAPERVLDVARAILAEQTLEGRHVAYFMVHGHAACLASLTRANLEELGRGMDNWTTVDTFGCYLSGPAWRAGQVKDAVLFRWGRSKDRWWRRAAVVSTVALNLRARGGTGDTARTLAMCERVVADHDDMVVKGLSWALRSLATVDPESVRSFLSRFEEELHARARREVLNKLDTGRKAGSKAAEEGQRRRKA